MMDTRPKGSVPARCSPVRTLVNALAHVSAFALVTALTVGCAELTPLQDSSVSMGPDPGGKTGEGVTPESTRTDHPAMEKNETPVKPREPATGSRPEPPPSVPGGDGATQPNAPTTGR